MIQKEHFGVVNECFTMADKYNVNFPSEDDDDKAVMMAACQFMDMLYFEQNYWLQCQGSIWVKMDWDRAPQTLFIKYEST